MLTTLRTAALAALCFWFPVGVSAEEKGPVVVELYTSQGCSSCPPADKMLHDLAQRRDVIALALHVDYWDYIGWKDVFGKPEHANRQRGYGQAAGRNMIYTPQMIIDGGDHVVGTKPGEVASLLMKHGDAPNRVRVGLKKSGQTLEIDAMGAFRGMADVHVVRFSPKEKVRITRGENRGKTLEYSNVVRTWDTVAQWDGRAPLTVKTKVSGNLPIAVLIQRADYGSILGAAALR